MSWCGRSLERVRQKPGVRQVILMIANIETPLNDPTRESL